VRALGQILLAALITGALVFLMVGGSDPGTLVTILRETELALLLLCLPIYVIQPVARALRLGAVPEWPAAPRLGALFHVAALHSLFNSMLPMRLGELSLPLLLRRHAGVGLGHAGGVLLLLRALDLAVVLSVGAAAAMVLAPVSVWVAMALAAGAAVLMVGLAGLRPLYRRVQARRGSGSRLRQRIAAQLAEVLAAARQLGTARLLRLTVCTVLVWMPVYAIGYLCARAVLPEISLVASVAAVTGMSLAIALPIGAFANLGTFQTGWAAVLVILGIAPEPALLSGFMFHAVLLGGSALVAGASVVTRRFRSGAQAA